MSRPVKIILYVVLLIAASVLVVKFHRTYARVMSGSTREGLAEENEPLPLPATGVTAAASNPLPATSPPPVTNAGFLFPDIVAATTNTAPSTNVSPGSNAPPLSKRERPRLRSATNLALAGAATAPAGPTFSTLMAYGAVLFLVVVCLGLMAAHDFSHLVAERFYTFILSDEGQAMKPPEYERAEQAWLDGRPLDAIQLMRDYLKGHPRELYVAIRIAEIYEKDLGNYLAAALELEEVLKHRLRPEQWGWQAIHLANLYSGKLNQTHKAVALLRRIDSEYGQTAAAAKARARLAQIEGESGSPAAPSPDLEAGSPPSTNLPKGFRPKTN